MAVLHLFKCHGRAGTRSTLVLFSWWHFVLVAGAYQLLLFVIAYLAEKGRVATQILKHPLICVLAFGVSCGSWVFYGSVGMAYELQHGYLAFYVGPSILLLFSAILIRPLFKLANNYQLASLADLFAFRYRSRWVGLLTALAVSVAMLPLLAAQIQAITDVIMVLDEAANPYLIALLITVLLCCVCILFGTRDVKPSEQHPGLLFALALESIFKLLVLLIIGAVAVFSVKGGMAAMQSWALGSAQQLSAVTDELSPRRWLSLLLIFSFAPLVVPHLFQILFRENDQADGLRLITWAAPVYLFLMALPVFPIMWAALSWATPLNPEYFTLSIGLALDSPALLWLTYVGGLAASTGVSIIAVLSLSSMLMNHLVLPFQLVPRAELDIYRWLIWTRRLLIGGVFLLVFVIYLLLHQVQNQSTLLITAYSGLLQMAPGLIGLLFWSRATRTGYIAGAVVGLSCWALLQLMPTLSEGLFLRDRLSLHLLVTDDRWASLIFGSLLLNALVFVVVSLRSLQSTEEKTAAAICHFRAVDRRQRIPLQAKNVREFIESLSKPLGRVMAEREVEQSLRQLKLGIGEYRPYALRRLRDSVEANLSGIMGPSVAQAIVARYLPYQRVDSRLDDDIHFLEENLDNYHYQLSGMAAELDRLRRHHRETLYRLPVGVCSLTADGEILLWNELMAILTSVPEDRAVGAQIDLLPTHWYELFRDFIAGSEDKISVELPGSGDKSRRWYLLHRTRFSQPAAELGDGLIILVEDETEHKMLQSELIHAERLASIGRLAAGVAHEIGNPITGIDCLAQDLKYAENAAAVADIARQIRHQTERVTKIVGSLVNVAHASGNKREKDAQPCVLAEMVQEAIDLLALSRSEHAITFVNAIAPELKIMCEPQRLAQVFINLLANARDASPAGTSVTVAAEAQYFRETVQITITDEGCGIKAEHLERIFDPFFTTKEVGKGTGLGLFVCYTIIEEHYGHISVVSPAPGPQQVGTQFVIRLPMLANVTAGNS